jgi:hypothetical protein
LAHAVNHTCHSDFQNCKFLHTGIIKDPHGGGPEDEGSVGGRRTSVVFVQVTRHVERDEEFFFLESYRTLVAVSAPLVMTHVIIPNLRSE